MISQLHCSVPKGRQIIMVEGISLRKAAEFMAARKPREGGSGEGTRERERESERDQGEEKPFQSTPPVTYFFQLSLTSQ